MKEKPINRNSGDWDGYYTDLFVSFGGLRKTVANRFIQIRRIYKTIEQLPDSTEKELLFNAAKLERIQDITNSITLSEQQKTVINLFLKMVHRQHVQALWQRKKLTKQSSCNQMFENNIRD